MSKASEDAVKRLRAMGATMYRCCGAKRPEDQEQQCELRAGHEGDHQAEVRTKTRWAVEPKEAK